MAERIVSIKMPASLLRELKRLTQEHHYIDVSEQVRSIVRQGCLKYTAQEDIAKLRETLEQGGPGAASMTKEQLLQELARLLKEGRA